MLKPETGEFKVDEPELLVHAELTLRQFLALNLPAVPKKTGKSSGWDRFAFSGQIDGMRANFWIYFRYGNLRTFSWYPVEEDKNLWRDPEKFVDWIRKVSKSPPPYYYDWGYIDTEPDEKTGAIGIEVIYKRDMEDRGFGGG